MRRGVVRCSKEAAGVGVGQKGSGCGQLERQDGAGWDVVGRGGILQGFGPVVWQDIANIFRENKTALNFVNPKGQTALMLSVSCANVALVTKLLEFGCGILAIQTSGASHMTLLQ